MDTLFKLPPIQLSPRLQEVKDHDIQTHHSDCGDFSWMAIPMSIAREKHKGYDGDFSTIAKITASIARLLEESGMCFYGNTKDEVIQSALKFSIRYKELNNLA